MTCVKSLLDTDFYILTMMQAIFHMYTNVWVRCEFKWRNWDKMHLTIKLEDFLGRLKERLDDLCSLKFAEDELKYLNANPYLQNDFVEYLRLFQLNRSYIRARVKDGQLQITTEGPLLNVMPFEVPVLSTVSQLYTRHCGEYKASWLIEGRKRLEAKVNFLSDNLHSDSLFRYADFGGRRRAELEWHDESVGYQLEHCPYFIGTSNVHLAKKYNIKAIGTQGHIWFQFHQQSGSRLEDSQRAALQAWADEYRGELGIALTDTLGFDAFLKDFDRYFALLFDGCRHDSGDPILWGEKLIDHYKSLRIDPNTKTAVFSDGLSFSVAVDLFKTFHSRINTSYGIGTYLTNDVGFVAPQIVIKNTMCNGRPTAKISDSPGKGMCTDPGYLEYLKKVIKEK